DGWRVAAALPARALALSEITWRVQGVDVVTRRVKLPWLQVIAQVEDDQLQRNASGSDVIDNDPAVKRGLSRIGDLCEALVLSLARNLPAAKKPALRQRLTELLFSGVDRPPKVEAALNAAPLV